MENNNDAIHLNNYLFKKIYITYTSYIFITAVNKYLFYYYYYLCNLFHHIQYPYQ